MIDEIKMAFPDIAILILSGVALVLGLISGKGKRKLFLIPGIIITAVIVNPLFYSIWYKFNSRAYWRMLWMIPVVSFCAFAPALLVETFKKDISKTAVMMFSVAAIVFFGVFVYKGTTFVEANNPDKLPDDVVAIAEALLELDDEPYVVADAEISTYLRQYSGKIKSLYGRDAVYAPINSPLAEKVFRNISQTDGDLKEVVLLMLNHDYKFFITKNTNDLRKAAILDAGFELQMQVNEYGIYKASGTPTEKRTYDELHRVKTITTIDSNGNPVDIGNGYAMVKYEYAGKTTSPYCYYYTQEGTELHMGSGRFHDFLSTLLDKDITVFIAVRDQAPGGITDSIMDDLMKLGIRTDLRDKYQCSYYAVITQGQILEDVSNECMLEFNGFIDGIPYSLISAGFSSGDMSSIVIDGVEYSVNSRGMNFVVFDNNRDIVVDSVGFDTVLPYIPISLF